MRVKVEKKKKKKGGCKLKFWKSWEVELQNYSMRKWIFYWYSVAPNFIMWGRSQHIRKCTERLFFDELTKLPLWLFLSQRTTRRRLRRWPTCGGCWILLRALHALASPRAGEQLQLQPSHPPPRLPSPLPGPSLGVRRVRINRPAAHPLRQMEKLRLHGRPSRRWGKAMIWWRYTRFRSFPTSTNSSISLTLLLQY